MKKGERTTAPAPRHCRCDPAWLLAGLVLAIGASVWSAPATRVLGHSRGEVYSDLWIQWLLQRELAAGRNPFFHTDIQISGDLWIYPVDLSTHLFRLFLGLFLPQQLAYNLAVLALVSLFAVAAVALAREVGAGRWASLVAGLVAAMHPAFLGFLIDGRIDSCTTGWAVLLLWTWLRLLRLATPRSALHFALAAGALVLSSPNYAFLMTCLLTIPTGVKLLLDRRRLWRPVGLGLVAACLFSMPTVLLFFWVEGHGQGRMHWPNLSQSSALFELVPRDKLKDALEHWKDADQIGRFVQDHHWHKFDAPIPSLAPTNSSLTRRGDIPISPGARRFFWIGAIALGLVGLLRRPRRTWPWLVGAAVMQILALGAGLGNAPPLPTPDSDLLLVLRPERLLSLLPFFSVFQNYGLFSTLSAVLLGVSAALGASIVWPRHPALVAVMALGLCFAEAQTFGPTPLPLPVTEVVPVRGLSEASRRCGDGGVIVFPRTFHERLIQTWHGKPIATYWNISTTMKLQPDQEQLRQATYLDQIDAASLELLRRHGIDQIVVLPEMLPVGRRGEVLSRFGRLAGAPILTNQQVAIYCLH